ncbi:Anaphase promoting complex subunit 4 WD40 domain [Trypanosoma vivax]|nr:Anaphase promoting complex subunit 4 WD40 domain [Trypanosoma vivax]
MNQTLEGHEADVSVVAWNHQYRKLTSSDASGQIIVWMLHKGLWLEEMINNRNQSTVSDLAWSVDGTRVCIVYEDGAVILGGVDGNRVWGKELKCQLSKVTWSPDDRFILFGTKAGEVYVHDSSNGHVISCMSIISREKDVPLAGLIWSPAWYDRPEPVASLAVCYRNGHMRLMRSVVDNNAFTIEAGITVTNIAWNPQGTTLAVCGIASTTAAAAAAATAIAVAGGGTNAAGNSAGANEEAPKPTSIVLAQFFSVDGVHLRTLRVNGQHCGGIMWEGDGLRVAIAVDAALYFANVRPDYKYAYFNKTLVYAYNRPDRVEDSVIFWNTRSNERTIRHIRRLMLIDSSRDACLIINVPTDERNCLVQLVNAIGTPIETRTLEMEPLHGCMNTAHVVVSDEENIYVGSIAIRALWWTCSIPSLCKQAVAKLMSAWCTLMTLFGLRRPQRWGIGGRLQMILSVPVHQRGVSFCGAGVGSSSDVPLSSTAPCWEGYPGMPPTVHSRELQLHTTYGG